MMFMLASLIPYFKNMIPYFNIFGMSFNSYTVLLLLAFIIPSFILKFNLKVINNSKWYDYIILTLISLLFGILGSYVFRAIEVGKISSVFTTEIFSYGKNFLGGFIFAGTGFYFFSIIFKKSFSDLISLTCPSLLIGYSIGRLGCFFSGDGCYGIKTNLCIGMSFPNGSVATLERVHPTPLYESIICLSLFIATQTLLNKSYTKNKEKIILIALIGIGIERFMVEFIRLNNLIYGLSQAQWISVFLILSVIIWYRLKK